MPVIAFTMGMVVNIGTLADCPKMMPRGFGKMRFTIWQRRHRYENKRRNL